MRVPLQGPKGLTQDLPPQPFLVNHPISWVSLIQSRPGQVVSARRETQLYS